MFTCSRNLFFIFLNLICCNKFLSYEFDNEEDIKYNENKRHSFTNKWVIHVEDGPEAARKVAENHNFIFHGQVGTLPNLYHIEHAEVQLRSRRSADEHHALLERHPQVKWAEQQKILKRKKRGYFSDPLFAKQWYLKNDQDLTRERCKNHKGYEALDIDVFRCWNKNITGNGVVVSILDDGLEYKHPDLKRNYDPLASYDFNSNDKDPFPRYSQDNINKHGTRCAGEVAAEANNGICGTGVAFNAKVGGIRMLDGEVTDAVEAGSLSYNPQHIDIYSSSWGPDDDGRTVDGPGRLAKLAFQNGILKGRKGRGSIFVWATGNGGRFNDYCSCDGYINSPYTISIGAVDNCGLKPWYAEPCPGTFAVTYSSGEATGHLDKQISTTDLHKQCTEKHTGTSAAAPLAAGIFALVLEANPKITWRDLQHLVAKTSKMVSPQDPDWQTNGAEHKVNSKFGFGALDSGALVELAMSKNWKTARPQHKCSSDLHSVNLGLKSRGTVDTYIDTDACSTNKNTCITKLEHVHVVITLEKRMRRGQVEIKLTSPDGTKSDILRQRIRDTSRNGFQNWAFLTIFHWDEKPQGKWKLSITDHSESSGVLKSWKLVFYGTCDPKANDASLYNITIDDEEICDDVCKRGCPEILAERCFECSHFCDCTIGKCVPACNEDLVADDKLRHCRRNLDHLDYNVIPNSGAVSSVARKEPIMGMALSAKFALICLALLTVSAFTAGIAYFAAKMPPVKTLPKGYHSVSRYPCADAVAVEEVEEVEVDLGLPIVKS